MIDRSTHLYAYAYGPACRFFSRIFCRRARTEWACRRDECVDGQPDFVEPETPCRRDRRRRASRRYGSAREWTSRSCERIPCRTYHTCSADRSCGDAYGATNLALWPAASSTPRICTLSRCGDAAGAPRDASSGEKPCHICHKRTVSRRCGGASDPASWRNAWRSCRRSCTCGWLHSRCAATPRMTHAWSRRNCRPMNCCEAKPWPRSHRPAPPHRGLPPRLLFRPNNCAICAFVARSSLLPPFLFLFLASGWALVALALCESVCA